MTVRTFNWCAATQLDCEGDFPSTAYLCVPASIMAVEPTTQSGFVEATITGVRASTCADACGLCKFVYTISYDDEQLNGVVLVASYINAVLCNSCLIEFIVSRTTP